MKYAGNHVVDDAFWMGWENGSAGTERDPTRRAARMGTRLRAALDPARWTEATRRTWRAFAAREGLPASKPPSVKITGTIRRAESLPEDAVELAVHRSKPLAETLRRFNCHSNNDIERVAEGDGSVDEIEALVAEGVGDGVALETASGLGHNRLTPRQIVQMLRQFRESAESHHLGVEQLLSVAGCDSGSPEAGSYSVVLNSDLGQPLGKIWAAAPPNRANEPYPHFDYTKKIGTKEVVRAALTKSSVPATDLLSFAFKSSGGGATLTLTWGDQAWSLDIQPAK